MGISGSENAGDQHRGFVRTWSATENAIENVARSGKDTLLVLDELGRGQMQTLGKAVYALIGGTPKIRQTRDGGERQQENWRVVVLSSGEMALSTAIEAATGKKAKAGTQTRIVELRAQARGGSGVYDGPAINVREFSMKLANAAIAHYGHAGPAFVERMMADLDGCRARFHELEQAFFATLKLPEKNGQLGRVAGLFATVGAAGEIAIEFGILPYAPETAFEAARAALAEWRAANGGSDNGDDVAIENRQAIQIVRGEIERWGNSKFAPIIKGMDANFARQATGKPRSSWYDPENDEKTDDETASADNAVPTNVNEARAHEMYGYKTEVVGKAVFAFHTEILRGIFKRNEMDPAPAIEALDEAGLLVKSSGKGQRLQLRIDAGAPVKFYGVSARIMES